MKQTPFLFSLVVIIMMGIFSSNLAEAKRLEDVTFQPEYQIDGISLVLQGAGLIKYLLFTVNAAALYLPESTTDEDPLADIPKRLELEYFRTIKAKDFVALTNTWIARNTDAETFARLQPHIDQFNALYKDVRPGDRYAITYQPGKGTALSLNGNVQGVVEGAEFARALFSIWLGPKPVSESLKLVLLHMNTPL